MQYLGMDFSQSDFKYGDKDEMFLYKHYINVTCKWTMIMLPCIQFFLNLKSCSDIVYRELVVIQKDYTIMFIGHYRFISFEKWSYLYHNDVCCIVLKTFKYMINCTSICNIWEIIYAHLFMYMQYQLSYWI